MDGDWVPSRYGESWTWHVARGLELIVSREIGTRNGPPPPYKANIFGALLSRDFATANEAKEMALRSARRVIADASLNLNGA
jgi:hypothetical protein